MWTEVLDQITPENWKSSINHTKKLISEWYTKIITEEVLHLIIDWNNDLSDSDSSDSDSVVSFNRNCNIIIPYLSCVSEIYFDVNIIL